MNGLFQLFKKSKDKIRNLVNLFCCADAACDVDCHERNLIHLQLKNRAAGQRRGRFGGGPSPSWSWTM